jgi:hypothetical protein
MDQHNDFILLTHQQQVKWNRTSQAHPLVRQLDTGCHKSYWNDELRAILLC